MSDDELEQEARHDEQRAKDYRIANLEAQLFLATSEKEAVEKTLSELREAHGSAVLAQAKAIKLMETADRDLEAAQKQCAAKDALIRRLDHSLECRRASADVGCICGLTAALSSDAGREWVRVEDAQRLIQQVADAKAETQLIKASLEDELRSKDIAISIINKQADSLTRHKDALRKLQQAASMLIGEHGEIECENCRERFSSALTTARELINMEAGK